VSQEDDHTVTLARMFDHIDMQTPLVPMNSIAQKVVAHDITGSTTKMVTPSSS